jgi:hypothetical protein
VYSYWPSGVNWKIAQSCYEPVASSHWLVSHLPASSGASGAMATFCSADRTATDGIAERDGADDGAVAVATLLELGSNRIARAVGLALPHAAQRVRMTRRARPASCIAAPAPCALAARASPPCATRRRDA